MIALESLNLNQIGDRLPPQNIEAEESILGGILTDPNAIHRIVEILDPQAFSHTAHKTIYCAAKSLYAQGKATDLLTVTAYLSDHNQLAAIGGQSRLVMIVDRTISAVNIDQYACLLMDKYLRRRVIEAGNNIAARGYDTRLELSDLLGEIEEELTRLALYKKQNRITVQSQEEVDMILMHQDIERIEAIKQPFARKLATKALLKKWENKTGAKFSEKEFLDLHAKWLDSTNQRRSYSLDEYFELHGKSSVDWLIAGWVPKKALTVLHAAGGQGKTSLINTMAKALITGQNWSGYEVDKPARILWVQTDQGPTVTTMMLDAQGFFALGQEEKDRQRIIDQWGIEEFSVLEDELTNYKYDLVIIDSLSSVSTNSIYTENEQEFARPLTRLRHIANKYDVGFLILHHSNSQGSIRGTTAIYNSADQVWKMERVKGNPSHADLIIQKSRFRVDHTTYRLIFDERDRSWVSLGLVTKNAEDGEENIENCENEKFLRIYNFLKANRGKGYEAIEISETLTINEHTCRKWLSYGLAEGLIKSQRGKRERAVYFVGRLDPVDPISPKTDTPVNSSKSEPILIPFDPEENQKQINQNQALDPIDPRDPLGHQKKENSDNFQKKNGSNGSKLKKQPETIASTSVDVDPFLADQNGSTDQTKIEEPDPPKPSDPPKFKVGDRVCSRATNRLGEVAEILDWNLEKASGPGLSLIDVWVRHYKVSFFDGGTGTPAEENLDLVRQLSLEDIEPAQPVEKAIATPEYKVGDRIVINDKHKVDAGKEYTIASVYDSRPDWVLTFCGATFQKDYFSVLPPEPGKEYKPLKPGDLVRPKLGKGYTARVLEAHKNYLIVQFPHSPQKGQVSLTSVIPFAEFLETLRQGIDKITLKALKHTDHNDLYRKATRNEGLLEAVVEREGKFWGRVSCKAGLELFNLEAVQVIGHEES